MQALAIVPASVFPGDLSIPIRVGDTIKRKPALSDVPLVLGSTERDAHPILRYSKI